MIESCYIQQIVHQKSFTNVYSHQHHRKAPISLKPWSILGISIIKNFCQFDRWQVYLNLIYTCLTIRSVEMYFCIFLVICISSFVNSSYTWLIFCFDVNLLNIVFLQKQKQEWTKQTIRTGTEAQKWRSYGGLSAGRGKGKSGGKGTGNKKHTW